MQIKISEPGIVGLFGRPDGDGPFPAVVALGGSDGGTPEYFLNLLVPEGFAAMALVYWGTPDTQLMLADVPLERVERGLRWLRGQPDVRTINGRVGLIGASKGAELALLAATTFPELVGPVVGYTPSSAVWMGVEPGKVCSSWTHNGVRIPFVPFPPDVAPTNTERGVCLLPIFERGLDNHDAVEHAAIPVEQATGPLLLVSGGDDRVWPAKRMSDMMVARMAAHGRSADIVHLHYPDAGHMLFPYTQPTDVPPPPFPVELGGTPHAAAEAHASAWPAVVRNLQRST